MKKKMCPRPKSRRPVSKFCREREEEVCVVDIVSGSDSFSSHSFIGPPAKVSKKTDDDGESNVVKDAEEEEDAPDGSSETKEDGGDVVSPKDKTADDSAATMPEGDEEEESEAASEADREPAPVADSEPGATPEDFSNGGVEKIVPQAEDERYEETGDEVVGGTTGVASASEDVALYDVSGLPPAVPSGLPDAPVDPTQAATISNPESIAEERAELAVEFVGRVIGKGGEMIRDLQARSGCRVDVDQNVPMDSPRIITYRGTRQAIDFAKQLVATLCSQEGKRDADLPLGIAARKQLVVPSSSIGKIIGRGGEMIRELQNRSKGKIQVDHSGAGVTDPSTRLLTITGTQEAVTKAEEMIMFLVANPQMDASQAIDMLVDDKTRGGGSWGSGPPYPNLPNQGRGMQIGSGYGGGGYAAPYGGSGAPYGGGGGGYLQPPGAYGDGGGGYHQPPEAFGSRAAVGTESEIFCAPKMYMGRIIGSRGITINDVQKRSGCDIQINQDVPPGHDCEISIKGSRHGIETAKGMLRDIIEMGPSHPYAGGTGGAREYRCSTWFAAKPTTITHAMSRRFSFHHSTAAQLWRWWRVRLSTGRLQSGSSHARLPIPARCTSANNVWIISVWCANIRLSTNPCVWSPRDATVPCSATTALWDAAATPIRRL